jgi:hypothetical protein
MLGTHIVLASFGVAFPAMMLVANYIALRRDDPDALEHGDTRWVASSTGNAGSCPSRHSP